jgi:transcriptional regulator with XRE-family HTH domain
MHARFQDRLQREFDERREKNPRYSLRAFAALLGVDHSTVSQILRGQRRVPAARIRAWARKLDLDPEEAIAYIAAEHLPDARTAARNNLVHHWTAEAIAVLTEPTHWEIFRACGLADFQSDSRWVAAHLGATVDEVNIAFTRLLRLGLVRTGAGGKWLATAPIRTDREFRGEALRRVRRKAAAVKVKLPLAPPRTTAKKEPT